MSRCFPGSYCCGCTAQRCACDSSALPLNLCPACACPGILCCRPAVMRAAAAWAAAPRASGAAAPLAEGALHCVCGKGDRGDLEGAIKGTMCCCISFCFCCASQPHRPCPCIPLHSSCLPGMAYAKLSLQLACPHAALT